MRGSWLGQTRSQEEKIVSERKSGGAWEGAVDGKSSHG